MGLRLKPPVQASLRRLLSPLLLGMALYWLQRITVNILYPGGLKGSSLFERMGLIARDMRSHRGVLDALHFLTWQISGSSISDTKVALTQIIEPTPSGSLASSCSRLSLCAPAAACVSWC